MAHAEADEAASTAILAVLYDGGGGGACRLALALLEPSAGALQVGSLSCSSEGDLLYALSSIVVLPAAPALLLTNSQLPVLAKGVLSLCGLREGEEEAGGAAAPTPVTVLRASCWALQAAHETLGRLQAGIALGTLLDLTDTLVVRCAGGLLRHARTAGLWDGGSHGSGGGGGGGGAAAAGGGAEGGGAEGGAEAAPLILPGGIARLQLADVMGVDMASLQALGVFPQRRGVGGRERGAGPSGAAASLAALLDTCRTSPGSRLLRGWLRRPSTSIPILTARQDAVAFLAAAAAQRPAEQQAMQQALGRAKDVARLCKRLCAFQSGLKEWGALRGTLGVCEEVAGGLVGLLAGVRVPGELLGPGQADSLASFRGSGSSGTPPHTAQRPLLLLNCLPRLRGPLPALLRALEEGIDWDGSASEERLVPAGGQCQELDEARALLANLPRLLGVLAEEDCAQWPALRGALSYTWRPMMGVLAVVPHARADVAHTSSAAAGAGTAGRRTLTIPPHADLALPSEFQLYAALEGETAYKSPRADAFDAAHGDVPTRVRDLENGVLRGLEGALLAHCEVLGEAGEALAEVDALCSYADAARAHSLVRPTLSADPVLFAKGLRHPLQELLVAPGAFVANDVTLDACASGSAPLAAAATATGAKFRTPLVLLTGPNASGKSIWLKSVGLLAVCAQAGSFVPAQRAVCGIVDRLFTRMHGGEAVSDAGLGAALGQSTFGVDVRQLSGMLRHATPRSLLLVDEFGKGTSAVDGMALLGGSIRALASGGARTVVTTHFLELLEGGLLGEGQPPSPLPRGISLFQMQVELGQRARGGEEGSEEEEGSSAEEGSGAAAAAGALRVLPRYRLTQGYAESSFGLECAEQGGVPRKIVQRARAFAAAAREGKALAPLQDLPPLHMPSDLAREAMAAVASLLRGRSSAEWRGGALGAMGMAGAAGQGLVEDMRLLQHLVRVAREG